MRKYLAWQLILIVVFGLLAVVPIVVGGFVAIDGFSSVMFNTISNNQVQIASDKAARIEQWLHERTLDIQGISGVPSVRAAFSNSSSRGEARQFLGLIKRTYGYYNDLCLDDLLGRLVLSTQEGTRSGQPCPYSAYSLSGAVVVSDVQITPPDTDPSMYLTGPVMSLVPGHEERVGTITARLDLALLDSITMDIHLGKTAEAYLVNTEGYFITGSRFEPGVRLHKRISTKGFRDCLEYGRGAGVYPDYRGEIVLGSYITMPGRGWCLLVEQDRNEAFSPIRRLRHQLAVFLLIAAFLVLAFVVATSNVIVGRIRRGDDQLEQKRKELNRAEKLASTGRLAAGVAHEINNPISSIMNCAALMMGKIRKNEYDPEYFSKFLTAIEKESRRTAGVVREFLSFSRATEPVFVPVEVNALIDETLVLLEPDAARQGIKVERQFAKLPAIAADRDQLKQVFQNIILNAFQAMPQGGSLTIRTLRRAKHIEIMLADTGAGIEPENLSKVFDPFFSTRPGGSGLGLSVVYGIIDRHNGSISVESEPGRGTRFTIRLPFGPSAARKAQ